METSSQSPQPVRAGQPQHLSFNIQIPSIYTNGVNIGITPSDIVFTLTINGQPFQNLNMSLITAKTLMANLDRAINDFETKTKSKVPTMKEVQELLKPTKNP